LKYLVRQVIEIKEARHPLYPGVAVNAGFDCIFATKNAACP